MTTLNKLYVTGCEYGVLVLHIDEICQGIISHTINNIFSSHAVFVFDAVFYSHIL